VLLLLLLLLLELALCVSTAVTRAQTKQDRTQQQYNRQEVLPLNGTSHTCPKSRRGVKRL